MRFYTEYEQTYPCISSSLSRGRIFSAIGFLSVSRSAMGVKKNVYVYYWKGASGYGASGKDKAVGSGDANNYPVTGYGKRLFLLFGCYARPIWF